MAVIFIMLFSTFLLVGIIFNIAARQYIQNSAIAQLDRSYGIAREAREAMKIAETILSEFPNELLNEKIASFALRKNEFRIVSNMFVLDAKYNLLGNQSISETSSEILKIIEDEYINLDDMKNRKMNAADGIYYVSSYYLPDIRANENSYWVTNENVYWIIYVDITGLSNFARTINRFLVILVFAMFIFAVFLAFFFSDSITQPIQKLRMLALNIGSGDFTSKDYKFKDKEFEDLNMELNKSAKQLSIYDNEQKAFFQNVSHELRTPLMSIQCYAEGISCDLMEPKKASDTILQETARLNEMVKDLLYISKIDNITSAYTAANVDLIEIIRECILRQQAVADKKNVRFSFTSNESAVYFDCVGELISRAIENILSNAIRYTNSEIIISCSKTAEKVEICIEDDGAGIKAEIMPHIFKRFYKGEDGHYGIGLSIVKSIIKQHGGIVKAENAVNGGASFTIIMPYENRS